MAETGTKRSDNVRNAQRWTRDWSNAVFSVAERNRRWTKVRGLMAREGIDLILCLPCTNGHDRGQADARYLTQLGENSDETTVAFPIEGPVTAWQPRAGVWPSSNWLTDVRAARRGSGGATTVAWIHENPHYRSATIALAGLDSNDFAHVRATEGEINWQSVEILKKAFRQARFVSATGILGEARWRKSAEEIAFLRKATAVAEATLAAMHRHARPGVSERRVFGHMMLANADAGGSFPPMVGWRSGPFGRVRHRLEQPTFRKLANGDVLMVEVEGRWGGYIAQIDQTAAVGAAPRLLTDAMRLVFEAFDRTLERIRPGISVAELREAARVEGRGGRICTHLGGHGRGTGDDGPLLLPRARDAADLVLEEGCALALKPSASYDDTPDLARWGDTVVVTQRGAERLGTRPQRLRELGRPVCPRSKRKPARTLGRKR